jgi:hypothetical protein
VTVVAVAVSAAGLAGAPAPAAAATLAPEAEAEMHAHYNAARTNAGRAALQYDAAATEVARSWAAAMADSGQFRHNPNLVAHVDTFVTRQWTHIGENIGRGWTVPGLFDAFMASPPHREVILGPYNRVGLGMVTAADGRLYVSAVFVLAPPLPVVSPAGWAPFASPEALAARQYIDFLNRPGDPSGIAYWAGRLRAGAIAGPAVVESFLLSPEFGGAIAPVVRLYLGGIGRLPDEPGLRYWLDTARSGVPIGTIAHAFASNAEYQQRYGGLSNAAYVDALYQTVFGRPADAAGAAYWTGELQSGRMGRGAVLLGMTSSPEYVRIADAPSVVTMAYIGMLRRSPDAGGFVHWVGQLRAGHSISWFAAGVLASAEYRIRVTGS